VPSVPRTEREQLGTDPSPEELEARAAAEEEAQQQAEAEAAAKAEQEQRPEGLPENFKSVDDVVRSQREAQAELTRTKQEMAEMRGHLEELQAYAAQSQEQPRAQADDPRAQYAAEVQAAIDAGDGQRLAELQEWLTQYNINQAFQGYQQQSEQQSRPLMETQNMLTAAHVKRAVQEKIADFGEYEQEIGDLLQAEPWRMPDDVLDNPALMENALVATYEAVKYKQLLEQHRQLEEAGVTTADVQRARKLGAQTLSGATGRSEQPSEADRQVAGMRKALDSSSWEAHISRPAQ
jgi:hypothetical protein